MTKKYQHKAPHHVQQSELRSANKRLYQDNEELRSENTRLSMALKLISGEDKEKLLKAIDHIKSVDQMSTDWSRAILTQHQAQRGQQIYYTSGTTTTAAQTITLSGVTGGTTGI